MKSFTSLGLQFAENGWLPDCLVRYVIRHLCHRRLSQTRRAALPSYDAYMREFVGAMNTADVEPLHKKANEQHYELPPEFFKLILG